MKRLLFIAILAAYGKPCDAQSLLKGRVYEKFSDTTLSGINVFNMKNRANSRSDREGKYVVMANEGDSIIFSAAGFKADTVIATFGMLITQHDVTLSPIFLDLRGVTVTGSYRLDSMERRNEYRRIYEGLQNITGGHSPSGGFGISLSPLSHFSKRAKRERELRKRLIREERESYIDFCFPRDWVARVTRLSGDSLSLFMYRYRPSYEFCRENDRSGMLLYINDKLREFRARR